MGANERPDRSNILRTLLVYLGGAWVFIEAINFLIDKYSWNTTIVDVLILLVIFGLPAVLINTWFQQKFTRKALILQILNGLVALTIITFTLVNPDQLNPTQLRLLKFKDNQKKLATSIESLVILPFDNFTGNDELEYFVAGMQSSLITDMGRIGALKVMSNTTSNSFKGSDKSVQQIASELEVDAAVEASITCLGEDSICIQTRLIYASGEEHQLWVQDYRVAKNQVLNFYNDVTKTISEEINIVLSPQEESMLAEKRTVDPEAYEAYLMGQFYWEKLEPESLHLALQYFQKAIDLDPEWADPYAGLANAWGLFGTFGFMPKSQTLPNTYKYMNKALELDPNSAQAHYVRALHAVWTEFDWEVGEKSFLKSLELNPNYAFCRVYYAHYLMCMRRSEEAIQQANLALELDPMRPLVLGLYGMVMRMAGDFESAIAYFEKALAIDPKDGFSYSNLKNTLMIQAYAEEDYERWFELWGEKVKGQWREEGRTAVLNTFEEKGHIAGIEEMFKMNEKYGNEGCLMSMSVKLERYLKLGELDKAMDHLELQYEEGDMEMVYLATNDYYPYLKNNPRYLELLIKMNL
jgi:TolB-like protein/Tfp pilus assembly protein PilF